MLHAFCWCAKDYRCLLITRWFLIQALYFSTTFIHWDLHRRDTIIQLLYLERNTLIWTIKRYTNIYWVSTIPGVIIILLLGLFLSIAPKQTYNSIFLTISCGSNKQLFLGIVPCYLYSWSIQRDNNILDQFYSTVLVLPVQLLNLYNATTLCFTSATTILIYGYPKLLYTETDKWTSQN